MGGADISVRFNQLTTSRSFYYAALNHICMRPSSLGGGRILRRTLSVRLSVCPSVPYAEVVYLADVCYLLFCLHVRAA